MQKKYFIKDLERDDWSQEGQIVFYQSLKRFDASKGLTLGCFFKINLERHVVSLLRKQGAQKRRASLQSVSWEEQLTNIGEGAIFSKRDRVYSFTHSIMLKELFGYFLSDLSAFEFRAFKLYLSKCDISEIGQLLRCEERKVQSAIERAKRKLKQVIC